LSSAAVLYATWLNARTAQTLAESSLESTALALSASAEIALRAGGTRAEGEIRDILSDRVVAYALIAGETGTILFHTNPERIGTKLGEKGLMEWLRSGKTYGQRMHGVLSVGNTGLGAMTSLIRNGMSWPSTDNVPFSMFPCGIVGRGDDNTFHGFLSKDRTMMSVTWTDNTGGSALMIFRKRGGALAQSDLFGTWNFHRPTAGSDNASSGWASGTMTMSSPGTANITAIQTHNNNMSEVGSSFFVSMGGNGVVTSSGDSTFHGVMSQDKNMLVVTRTGAGGQYDLMILMRSTAGVSYSTNDLMGDWMQHGIVSGNPNDTNWNFGQMVMDSTGQATFNGMMDRTGAFSMQPGTFAMNSSGFITIGGMGMGGGMTYTTMVQTYSGFMNPAKDFMVATYTDGNGGYQLGIGMK
jgi:hypothetical protein